jgi:hypothetical protein
VVPSGNLRNDEAPVMLTTPLNVAPAAEMFRFESITVMLFTENPAFASNLSEGMYHLYYAPPPPKLGDNIA